MVTKGAKNVGTAGDRGQRRDVGIDELDRGLAVDVEAEGVDPAGNNDKMLDVAEVLGVVGVDEEHVAAAYRVLGRSGEAQVVRKDPLQGRGVPVISMCFLKCDNTASAQEPTQKANFMSRSVRVSMH